MEKNIIIIAPHGDDEIIGTSQVFATKKALAVFYMEDEGSRAWCEKNNCEYYTSSKMLESCRKNSYAFFFPDPYFETHPAHRHWGAVGEKFLRQGERVYFYSTNMSAPYIHEVKNWRKKKELLDKYYPEKSDLWKYEHKYFLFEGYCKWIV